MHARGGALPTEYREASGDRRADRDGARRRASGGRATTTCCPGNIIRAQEGDTLLIVDWEYAGMGHPFFDLGNLSVNNDFDEDDDERLLSAYHGRRPRRSRARAAEADARAVGRPRGGLGRRAGERVRPRLRLRRLRRRSTSSGCVAAARELDFEEWPCGRASYRIVRGW